MKNTCLSILIIAAALLAGCASLHNQLVLDTVSPGPEQTAPASGSGALTVYSAYKVNADFNSRDPNRREYSDYHILDQDRKPLEYIHNVTDDVFQNAISVTLPAGRYFIVARSNGYGIVTVPVIIAADHHTVLHFDGNNAWPDASAMTAANSVRLPDGQIVGWKTPSTLPAPAAN